MRSPARVRTVPAAALILIVIAGIFAAGCTDLPSLDDGSSLRAGTTGDLRAYFLDVGQGDSSVILFKDKVILIDAGETDQGDRVVSDLENLGVRKIDLLVATHPHSDHIGGMQKVLAAFTVGKVLDSGIPSTSSLYEHFLETVDEENIPYAVAEKGMTIDLDPSLGILVLSPPEERTGDDINTNSIVLRISYGTVNLLYTGDATTAAEDAMMKTGYPLTADILKVGHHGSSGSSSAAFLGRVDPEVAIISLGRDNDYGHPHQETLERLKAAGPLVFRTDQDGTVLVESDGSTYSVVTEKNSGNIWSHYGPVTATPVTTRTTGSPVTTGTTAMSVPFTLPVTLPSLPSNLTNITVPVPSLTIPSLQVGNASWVQISAVQFNAPGDDTQNLNGEWVQLKNRGDGPVLMTGWTLSDRTGTEPYRFPAFLLMPGSTVTVYTGSGVLNDTALFMGRTGPLWGNSGDLATLKDGDGNIIDRRSEADPS
jgi:competence protein ComEC